MTSPTVTVFTAILDALVDAAADGVFGPTPPRFRFKRFLPTTDEQRAGVGCIALDFEGDSLETDESESIGVLRSRLQFGLELDYDVPLESDDPTGLGSFQPLLPLCMKVLKDEDGPMLVRGWLITQGDLEVADNAGNDVARLVQHANVVYRTSTTDPTVLF